MCGIIAGISLTDRPINEDVVNQYQDQHTRGQRGFGAAIVLQKGKEHLETKVFRATTEPNILIDLKLHPSQAVLFHHRMPTSSSNTIKQTHPIFVFQPKLLEFDYLFVHNGVINNPDKVKETHEEMGVKYSTDIGTEFNDSECIATDLALFLEKKVKEVTATGSAAIIGWKIDRKTNIPVAMICGRNSGNPLKFARNQHRILVSSEGPGHDMPTDKFAIIDLTKLDAKQKSINIDIKRGWNQTTRSYQTDNERDDGYELNEHGYYQRKGIFPKVHSGEKEEMAENITKTTEQDNAQSNATTGEKTSTTNSDDTDSDMELSYEDKMELARDDMEAMMSEYYLDEIHNMLGEFMTELIENEDPTQAALIVESLSSRLVEIIDEVVTEMNKRLQSLEEEYNQIDQEESKTITAGDANNVENLIEVIKTNEEDSKESADETNETLEAKGKLVDKAIEFMNAEPKKNKEKKIAKHIN